MSLTRRMLKAMGIEDEKIEQIIEAHSETVSALKEQCEELTEKAESGGKALKELEKLKAANKSSEDWKEKYEKLEGDIKNKETNSYKEKAVIAAYVDIGIPEKYAKTLAKTEDLSKIQLDENKKIVGETEFKNKVKAEKSDFISEQRDVKVEPQTPITTTPTKISKSDILKMGSDEERLAAIVNNIDQFKK